MEFLEGRVEFITLTWENFSIWEDKGKEAFLSDAQWRLTECKQQDSSVFLYSLGQEHNGTLHSSDSNQEAHAFYINLSLDFLNNYWVVPVQSLGHVVLQFLVHSGEKGAILILVG